MQRRTFISLFAAMLAMFLTALTSTGTAATPQPAPAALCCTYTVDILGIDPTCLPFSVQTLWSDGSTDNNVYSADGIYTVTVPSVPCPAFKAVSIDNGVWVPAGQDMKVKSPVSGCCFLISSGVDGNGCAYIKIRPC